ncbi:MAG: hypothetical protein JO175_04140 [Candidatus Eremiobacteraeota bacterium]|nr:hypothetical protein [Candidatus Eremiobacteraeota bacterium]
MMLRRFAAMAIVFALTPGVADARGFARGGGGGASRGGWDFHGDTGTHSSTGPGGTNRTTTVNQGANGYNRTTTANNGQYSRTSTGGYNASTGNAYHGSSASSPYGSQHSSTTGNVNTGNYSHSGSGSNQYGSYSNSGSGNAYNRTYSGSGTATNAYGQTYHTGTYANNGYVYHGAVVTNPVYYHGPAWGWNGGVAWYPAPYYYGGGFWGAFAIGTAAAAIAYGTIVTPTNVTVTSYQVAPESPGAKLLQSYQLTQVPCGPPNLVVVYGPNNSAICAKPNNLVAAGNYSVNSQTLTLTSEKPAS